MVLVCSMVLVFFDVASGMSTRFDLLCNCFTVFAPSHRSLKLDFPKPEEPPPALWWSMECDHSLLVGIVKHGE